MLKRKSLLSIIIICLCFCFGCSSQNNNTQAENTDILQESSNEVQDTGIVAEDGPTGMQVVPEQVENANGAYLNAFASDGYVKSATYYGDEWNINFWNSEMEHLHEDMQKIKEDGFNSIILLIPWREFQPGLSPIAYNLNFLIFSHSIEEVCSNTTILQTLSEIFESKISLKVFVC